MGPDVYAKFMAGVWGSVVGAVAAMLIGFQMAGWTTASTTQKISDEAVLASRAAICVAQFKSAAAYKANAKAFSEAEGFKKSEFIEKGGWDKMPGQESASWGVAGACVAGLEAAAKAGT